MFGRVFRQPITTATNRHKRFLCILLKPHLVQLASGAWIGASSSSISSSFSATNHHNKHFFGRMNNKNLASVVNRHQQQSALFSTVPEVKEMKHDALQIINHAIEAVNPYVAVQSHVRVNNENGLNLEVGSHHMDSSMSSFHLGDNGGFEKIVVISFGKASSAMATALVQQLKGMNDSTKLIDICGAVICKDDHATPEEETELSNAGIQMFMASHPVPDERSADAADYALKLVQEHASSTTLVICCISGGGSALFCKPRAGLSLQHLQEVNSALLASGMGIQDCNVIRKRLEDGKGGRLAALCHPSQLVTLVLSDVLGDPLDLIASGPTVPDTSTREDAWEIVQRFNLADKLPLEVVAMLQDPDIVDSPLPDHPIFATSKTVLVGNNALAVHAAAKEAERLGYRPVVLGTQMEGEAKEVAIFYTRMALHLKQEIGTYSVAPSLPVALIAGGETTVSLPSNNSGKGGRNQELALAAAIQLKTLNLDGVVLASAGTDGTDGPTDAAGAIVDCSTVLSDDLGSARQALSKHDAYTYFDQQGRSKENDDGPLIRTGPTGTNVADVCVTLIR